MLNDIFKAVGPIIAAAMAGKFENGDFRFDNGRFHFDGDWDGVPIGEFDLTQGPPEKVIVLGPTTVKITEGKTFRIHAEGEGADTIRFSQRDGKLAVARRDAGRGTAKQSLVELTMPAPRSLAVAGSGTLEANTLAETAKVSVAGSGTIRLDGIACERLRANLMGSGKLHASGTVGRLKLVSAGSGVAELADLEADKARLSVTGSGSVKLASDGEVEAKMIGSGDITVYGRARCQVRSMGSGRFNCVPRGVQEDGRGDGRDDEPEAPRPPKPPKPPKSGGAAAKPQKSASQSKPAKPAKLRKAAQTVKKPAKKRKTPAKKVD